MDIFDEEDDHPLPLLGRHASISYLVETRAMLKYAQQSGQSRKGKEKKRWFLHRYLPVSRRPRVRTTSLCIHTQSDLM